MNEQQTEALKLAEALNELLESFEKDGRFCKSSSIRNELYDRLKQTLEESKEALAQQEQEPLIPFRHKCKWCGKISGCKHQEQPAQKEPLFKPLIDLHHGLAEELKAMDEAPQRTWVGLTTDEYDAAIVMDSIEAAVTFVEAKLKEKNT